MVLRMENPEAEPITKKRKRETKPFLELGNLKPISESPQPKKAKNIVESSNLKPISASPQRKKVKNKKTKSAPPVLQKDLNVKPCLDHIVNILEPKKTGGIDEDISKRYPILENHELVQKFLSIPMTNNQKGRIRQLLKDSLKGTSEFLLPDVIHSRIQSILKSSSAPSESDLRKIRILYNMLKTALSSSKSVEGQKNKNKKSNKKNKQEVPEIKNIEKKVADKVVKKDQGDVKKQSPSKSVEKKKDAVKNESPKVVKPKGPKRYVVFVGNLPPDIDKEKIMQHFSEFNECIVNIRIPKRAEDKKSSIAYVELKNEPTYELALSKHHSMLGNKRINVLYTTQKNGKVSKTEAKSKSAKLIALQKAGKLIGSIPANRKRSHRRMKMKRAQAKLAAESS